MSGNTDPTRRVVDVETGTNIKGVYGKYDGKWIAVLDNGKRFYFYASISVYAFTCNKNSAKAELIKAAEKTYSRGYVTYA